MSSHLENTVALPFNDDSPFAYGEQTVLQMQSQPWLPPDDEPLARLEEKLDLALRQIEKLQHRIESLDLTLARVLSR